MITLTITLLAIIMLTSCSTDNTKTQIKEIDKICSSVFPENEPGAAVLILKGDDIMFDKGYGIADINTKDPVNGDTFFNIASISKQFTATAAMLLQERGLISLSDPVHKYFPEFKADFWDKITLAQLLSHCSGVPDARPREDRDFVLYSTDKESIGYMVDLDTLHFEPGTEYEYINPTFQLFYTLIERVTGEPFEQFIQENIFDPAGMKKTLYFDPEIKIANMAHGYEYEDVSAGPEERVASNDQQQKKEWYEYDYGEETFFGTKSDGGIYTSTHEFVNWEKALRNNTVMSEKSRTDAQSPHIYVSGSKYCDYQNRPDTWYGYGWFIDKSKDHPLKIYHTGDNGGFKALACRYPEQQILVLIFSNRADWDRWDVLIDRKSVV